MNGGSDYVDLGNWTGETCFVDVDSCEQGSDLVALVTFKATVMRLNLAQV